jgi:hypothetical protein
MEKEEALAIADAIYKLFKNWWTTKLT